MKLAEILKKNYYIYKIGRKFRIFLFVLKDVLLLAKYRTRKDNTENGVIIAEHSTREKIKLTDKIINQKMGKAITITVMKN